jgi:hypothetical protein
MKAFRISRPAAVRIGMFWRLGSEDDRRPVAATFCRKEEWTRHSASASRGSAST